ncbi:hypothetical protein B0J12DRAFT_695083 [Macrophomina phaseolina]|uniref:Uncharacterized protein n=1 Tax=Macrophomina phaseolina TaxID=35725 RepID=A0ABQ8GTU8_9PEZI|nr:hypothetical protein B0J12DRAFT_695083 [Macrophomina phaseolina]
MSTRRLPPATGAAYRYDTKEEGERRRNRCAKREEGRRDGALYGAQPIAGGFVEELHNHTRATLPPLRAGVAAALLPQTLGDAARVAQELGLRYLQADGLSPTQEGPEDWLLGFEKTGAVYGQARGVPAATGAANDAED